MPFRSDRTTSPAPAQAGEAAPGTAGVAAQGATGAPAQPGRRRSRGQSLVEFALVLPIMLVIMAGAIDLGRMFYAYVAVENAAKEGALFGARNPLCPDNTNVNCRDPLNVEWRVHQEASNLRTALGSSALTMQSTCRDAAGAVVQPINNCLSGMTYVVSVSYRFGLITPILNSIVGTGLTLSSESRATVFNSAFDPTGLETLIWVNSTNADNASTLATVCNQADPVSNPNYYYGPCQDLSNADNYLEFAEAATVTYRVRIRNTGNIPITGISYAYKINGTAITTPVGCDGGSSLPTSLAAGAAPRFCTFTRTTTVPGGSTGPTDFVASITASGSAQGVPTGQTNGVATVKIVPRPRLAVTLRAAPYEFGGQGNGTGSPRVLDYSMYTSPLTLARQAASADDTIQNPTGWLYLTVTNSGGPAKNFTLGVTRNGSAIGLVGLGCPSIPGALGAGGGTGSSYTCVFPQRLVGSATNHDFAVSTSATNAVVTGSPTFRITTQDCASTSRVVPNLVDVLLPSPDKTHKTVLQAQAAWTLAGLTGTLTASPDVATNIVLTQSQRAYTCVAPGTNATITTQVGQP